MARYEQLVFTIARRSGLDSEQAADVLQLVFAALVEQLGRLEHPDLVGAWLVTSARRESWRQRRRGRRAELVLGDVIATRVPADADAAPGEELLRAEERDVVRAALDSLDERCRRMLTLLFAGPDPPSYSAVASALGIPEGSVGPTRARCLEKLRRIVERLED